jgi:hypothetical protein
MPLLSKKPVGNKGMCLYASDERLVATECPRRHRTLLTRRCDKCTLCHDMLWCLTVACVKVSVSSPKVCGRSLAGIAGSSPTGGMDFCLLWVLCVVRCLCVGWSLVQRSPTEYGVSQCDCEDPLMMRPWPIGGCCAMKNLLPRIYLIRSIFRAVKCVSRTNKMHLIPLMYFYCDIFNTRFSR